jgi:hypothetical protein
MTAPAPRLVALGCPTCGGSLDARAPGLLDCPACGSSVTILADEPPRSVVRPSVTGEQALESARRFLAGPPVDRLVLRQDCWASPRLAFAPFYVVERIAESRGGELGDTLEMAPAVELPNAALDAVSPSALRSPREPFDPVELRRRAVLFDPVVAVDEAAPVDDEHSTLAERVEVVYLPLWLLEARQGGNVFELVVDGSSGELLGGRAPADPMARAGQAIAIVYGAALILALIPKMGALVVWLFEQIGTSSVVVLAIAVGMLLTSLAWSWDQIRFRHELLVEAGIRRIVAINRPEKTLLERLRDGLLKAVRWLFTRK